MADIDLDSVNNLFRLGEFAEIVRRFARAQLKATTLEPTQRVVLAHALALTGDLEAARPLALLDSQSAPQNNLRPRVESILGLISEREGDRLTATLHFHTSMRLANEVADHEQYAWSCLHLFRILVDGHPMEVLRTLLLDVRNAVMRAGNPYLTSYLHQCVAVLEGQTGRLDEALRHCQIAESLLDRSPNTWLQGNALLNRACLAWLNCEFNQASQYMDGAKRFISQSGHARCSGVVNGNIGHLELISGRFEKAQVSFSKGLNDSGVVVALSAADGLARVYLALGRLDECEAALARIDRQAEKHHEIASIYHIRWSGLTKARLLIRRGKLQAAIDWLKTLEGKSQAIQDVPFAAALHLLAADAFSKSGCSSEAASRLLAAHQSGITEMRELQPQYYYASAQMLNGLSTGLWRQLEERALKLWRHQGNTSVRMEMQSVAPDDRRPGSVSSALVSQTAASDIGSIADSLAAIVDLAHSPRLIGSELLDIIRTLDCSPDAKIVETRITAAEPNGMQTEFALPLGVSERKKLTLVCRIPDSPLKAVLLGDVLRIARAALTLERARQEERARAALWPATPVEEQAGALFLAEEMQSLLAIARRIAPTNVTVLITGETGTGKEVLARLIHAYSPRANNTFSPFNCTATPKDMLDAQLFGHRKGAFTGAVDNFPGVIRAAAGGTLFLDEIGETTLDVQPKLLRFLESGEVHPIGDVRPVQVDVRIIAATNADLDTLVTQNRFREDLYYRLNIVKLHLPPLRERRVEIPALANHYLQKHGQEYAKGDLRLAEETMEYLVLYRWPGNVRQLANEMRRMAALAENRAVLMPEHLSPEIAASRRTIPASERVLEPTEVVVRLDQPMASAIQHIERAMMKYAMAKCGGRMEETAALLGLSRKGLYLKRQRFGIKAQEGKARADVA